MKEDILNYSPTVMFRATHTVVFFKPFFYDFMKKNIAMIVVFFIPFY